MTTYTNTGQDDLTIGDLHHVRWVLAQTDSAGAASVITDEVRLAVATTKSDGLTIGDAIFIPPLNTIGDTLTVGDAVQISNAIIKVADGLLVRDGATVALQLKVSDGLTVGDTSHVALVVRVADSITAGDQTNAGQTAVNKVVDVLAVTDALTARARSVWLDSLTIGDEALLKRVTKALVADALTESEANQFGYTSMQFVVDSATIADALKIAMVAINTVEDDIVIEDAAKGAGPGGAWRSHAELMAMSRYTNYPFNSMAAVNGYLLGAGPSGIYRLDMAGGLAYDAGADINAVIQYDINDDVADEGGEMKSDPHFKHPRYAYSSYQSDGVLRVTLGYVDRNGTEQSASFDMPTQTADQYITGRIDLGRGIRSRYLRPAITNVDGAAFGMNEFKIVVDSVRRKI